MKIIQNKVLLLTLITSSLIASQKSHHSSLASSHATKITATETGKVSIRAVCDEALRKLGRATDSKISALVNRKITLDTALLRKMKLKFDHAIATDAQNGKSIKEHLDSFYSLPISYPKLSSAHTLLRDGNDKLAVMLKDQSCPPAQKKMAEVYKFLESDCKEVLEHDVELEAAAPGFQKAYIERSEANNIRTTQQLIDAAHVSE